MARKIVLIHGAWMTPLCWDSFQKFYEDRGYSVLAPPWPFDERPIAELRKSPDPGLAGVGIAEIVNHYDGIVRALPEPPILIGHSFGGLTTQMLLDRGLGVCGVAIDSAPPKGVGGGNFAAFRTLLPVLVTPFAWKKVLRMSLDDFAYGWAHTIPPDEQRKAWEGYVVPSPGRPFWQNTLSFMSDLTKVNFQNAKRAPLLLLAGGVDRAIPPGMNQQNYEKYKGSGAVTDFKEFAGRSHWTIKQPGWEDVAGYAIEWVEKQIGKL
ncbi:MAG TPA: alpha/beta hydrolase [Thermoanaerobaculia bacterium]|nr:alpha/beta hydrolase [Thermoanaerobaculia bacterium]